MKVSVIIPAYNEATRLPAVLEVITGISELKEIIVVDDGSKDNTSEIAKSFNVKVIRKEVNRGKGAALQTGLENTDSDVVIFLDADLVNLTEQHLMDLIKPVRANRADMTIGYFRAGRLTTNLSQKITPILNGQRALNRKLIEALPDLSSLSFGVEVFLSRYSRKKGFRVEKIPLVNLSQVLKEEKKGFWSGAFQRMKMYSDIFKAILFLRKTD